MSQTRFRVLPKLTQNEYVEKYEKILHGKRFSRFFKRIFDLIFSVIAIVIFLIPMIFIGLIITFTSSGGPFFVQARVGIYGKKFAMIKFRTMTKAKSAKNLELTVQNDARITKVGEILRKFRLDELPQFFNIFLGQMSFVGPRPEVRQYVDEYTGEMMATLLIRPGMAGLAQIEFSNESEILSKAENPQEFYINEILPQKCKTNLAYIEKLSLKTDVSILAKTFLHIFR